MDDLNEKTLSMNDVYRMLTEVERNARANNVLMPAVNKRLGLEELCNVESGLFAERMRSKLREVRNDY